MKDRVYLVSESFYNVDPVSVGSWLDKTFIAPGEIKEIDQAAWSNNPGWKLIRKDAKADWQLEDSQPGETLDKAFAGSFANFAPTIVDVRPPSVSPDETGLKDPFKVTVKTFDGFTYDFLLGKEGPDKARYLQLSVSADLPSARTPDPNESAETKKKQDEEFDQKMKGLKERLEKEKKFEKWVFLVPDWNLEQILKRRDEILSKATPSPSPSAAPFPALPSAALPTPVASPSPQASPSTTPEASPGASARPQALPRLLVRARVQRREPALVQVRVPLRLRSLRRNALEGLRPRRGRAKLCLSRASRFPRISRTTRMNDLRG